jgi:hypothetical protein
MTKNERAQQINSGNALKGFWNQPINYSEKLVLVCTELSEAIDAHRKGLFANDQITINMQTPDSEFKALYEREVKGSVDEELADAAIRIFDFMGRLRIPISEKYLLPNGLEVDPEYFNFADYVGDIMSYVLEARGFNGAVNLDNDRGGRQLNTALAMIESLCKKLEIDLYFHMDLKVKYNSFREYLHGKKY